VVSETELGTLTVASASTLRVLLRSLPGTVDDILLISLGFGAGSLSRRSGAGLVGQCRLRWHCPVSCCADSISHWADMCNQIYLKYKVLVVFRKFFDALAWNNISVLTNSIARRAHSLPRILSDVNPIGSEHKYRCRTFPYCRRYCPKSYSRVLNT
jgi:hypothetical protein